MQDGTEDIKEIIKEDVWGSIKNFLDLGFHIGEGEKAIDLTIGLLLLLTVTIVVIRNAIPGFFTRLDKGSIKGIFHAVTIAGM